MRVAAGGYAAAACSRLKENKRNSKKRSQAKADYGYDLTIKSEHGGLLYATLRMYVGKNKVDCDPQIFISCFLRQLAGSS